MTDEMTNVMIDVVTEVVTDELMTNVVTDRRSGRGRGNVCSVAGDPGSEWLHQEMGHKIAGLLESWT
jgi:hypothetical protein